MTTIIGFCFVIGLAASAIAGAAIFAAAAMHLLGAVGAALLEGLERSLSPTALEASSAGEEFSRPRARLL